MRVRLHPGLLLLPLLVACGTAPPAPSSPSDPSVSAFVGVTVIPMTGPGIVLPDHTVLVRNGRIARVGPRAAVEIPAGALRIDGAGRYLLPGLADLHVHLEYFEDPGLLRLFLDHGVTTVRNMDGRPYLLEWRRRIAAGELAGPTIVTAGPLLDGDPPLRDDPFVVPGLATIEEIRLFVEAGLAPEQALAAATREAARFLGQEKEFGTIAPGLRADLLLLAANPLEDVAHLDRRIGVMARGRWYPNSRRGSRRTSPASAAHGWTQ